MKPTGERVRMQCGAGGGRREEAGSTLVLVISMLTVCSGLSAAVLVAAHGRQREADAALERERAFQLAEAGTDWAIARIRMRSGSLPSAPVETRSESGAGMFTVRYGRGDANGRDDDGDGAVDEYDERHFAQVTSTGNAGGLARTVEVVLRKAVEVPAFDGSLQLNVETPILDFNGNSFRISGEEHGIDGTPDPSRPAKPGIASPANVADVQAQIDPRYYDQITGAGGMPSIAKVSPIDLERIVQQARRAADWLVEPGTHTSLSLGTPTEEGVVIAYCAGDLHLSGGGRGAGALVVDGDLRISGGFEWIGILIVRGRVDLVGGGAGKRLIGVLAVGEEVTSTTDSAEVTVSGTVDVLYSSDAVELAAQKLAIVAVMAWREVANP